MDQLGALILQIDQVVRVACGIIGQRNFGQPDGGATIETHLLIVGDAAEEIIRR
jgi:hypothetical protein